MGIKSEIYPYGFKSYVPLQPKDSVLRKSGDADVEQLADDFFIGAAGKESWVFVERAMTCALRLFGPDFYIWAVQQTDNRYVNDKSLRCVADSVKFIASGNRDITAIHWGDLIDVAATEDKSPATESRKAALVSFRELATASRGEGYLHRWLSHPSGLSDLITMLVVYFGPVRSSENRGLSFNPSPKNPHTQRLSDLLQS